MVDRPKHLADTTLIDTGKYTVIMVVVPAISTNDTVTFTDFVSTFFLVSCFSDFSSVPSWSAAPGPNGNTLTTSSIVNAKIVMFTAGVR